jgi:hypothetical protein
MSKLRSVNTSFWSDPFIEGLSAEEKLIYLYFITNEKTNMLGIYELSLRKMSFELGISEEIISNALKRFEILRKVKYQNNYVILKNYMKHQKYNTNMKKSAIECYLNLPKCLIDSNIKIDKSNTLEAFETLSNGLGMVRKEEVEYETEIEEENKDTIYYFLSLDLAKENDKEAYALIKNYFMYLDTLFPNDKKIQTRDFPIKEYTVPARKLVKLYSFDEIETIIKFAGKDEFWSQNITNLASIEKNWQSIKSKYKKSCI